jgi:oxygen-independent coproporphyrinogen-3 oxidase
MHGVYVHVPWCKRRCPYCAFYVEVDRGTPWGPFVDRVLAEHTMRAPEFGDTAATVFLGGGTPSRMPGDALRRLLDGLPRAAGAEVTAETNPEDATPEWLEAALEAGVNRLSLGVQTLDPKFAHLLNRAATVREAAETLDRVGRAGFRSWSVDLIFGLPGQTLADVEADLERLLAYGPPHVSLYGLTIEPGTPFERASFEPAGEDLWREMYDTIVARLKAVGIERYEVSNFARPGHSSAHNRLYWTDQPYMGLGPSAHGYAPDGRRWKNVADVGRYLAVADPTEESELPTGDARAMDLLVSALRGVDGVDRAHLSRTTGRRIAAEVVESLRRAGVLRVDGERIALTDAGFPLADGISARLADALVPVD